MAVPKKTIQLSEFKPELYGSDDSFYPFLQKLWEEYDKRQGKLEVEFPSPKTENKWLLTSLGWVGTIPLSEEIEVRLNSKVPILNIFRMLEYAYRLQSFHFLDGLVDSSYLEEIYDRLARILALKTQDRARKGFYRSYLHKNEYLPFLRGRMDVERVLCRPWDVKLQCNYEEHTADIEENQILAWTLSKMLRASFGKEETKTIVRRAYRCLQGYVKTTSFKPSDCVGRLYNRLNSDYQPLHSLCRFFLEQTGPTHLAGSHKMIPFLVDMARLFELFVSEWLRTYLPVHQVLKAQERVSFGDEGNLSIKIDLVLYDAERNEVRCVMDTKYKIPAETPDNNDINQVVAYATAKGCKEAILIHPAHLAKSFDVQWGPIRVRSLAFDLSGDLNKAGAHLMEEILNYPHL